MCYLLHVGLSCLVVGFEFRPSLFLCCVHGVLVALGGPVGVFADLGAAVVLSVPLLPSNFQIILGIIFLLELALPFEYTARLQYIPLFLRYTAHPIPVVV